jgi:hypothetical protein
MNHPLYTPRTIALVCVAVVVGILCWYFLSGTFLQPAGPVETGPATENTTTESPLETDAEFTIAEVNISEINFIPIVHVTYEDLKKYPELEQSTLSGFNDTKKWNVGTKMIALYSGNVSQYTAFVDAVCRGKPITECNQGVLFEYHGVYYKVDYDEPRYHHTAPPVDPSISPHQQE